MDTDNETLLQDFLSLGPSTLFMLFLVMYVLTVGSNMAILMLVSTSHQLHTPMYFFLSNLSFLEIWYTTTAVPKALAILLGRSQTISFTSCLLQMYLVFSLGCTEYFLLAAMAYDRYLAIWTIMRSLLAAQLALGSCVCGFPAIVVPMALISVAIELVASVIAFVVILSSCLITMISYIYIISTILRIPSTSGQSKAFSKCSSHLTVVLIWYGSTIFLHVRTSIKDALDLTEAVHVLNTVVTPVLNPFIYTLCNKEVRESLLKKWKGK
uniref:Olfactory receptor family 6 subfamily F member 1 n=1 Tax=Propithecus coquereli TaxID=379532 RepID=A0A2K6GQR7_PROCO